MSKINKYLLTTKAWKTEKMTDVNLSRGEYELIMMMANNKETTLDEMLKTVYEDNEYMKDDYQSMRLRLYRLRKKGFNIKNLGKKRYVLKDEIYIK